MKNHLETAKISIITRFFLISILIFFLFISFVELCIFIETSLNSQSYLKITSKLHKKKDFKMSINMYLESMQCFKAKKNCYSLKNVANVCSIHLKCLESN